MARKVLVVDDDPDEIELLREAFSEVAPRVTCYGAANGLAALDYLSDPSQVLPDIILLDINMPVMNGWDFLRNVKKSERFREIPVVVYTTTNREQDRHLADSLGAKKFIRKPDNYSALKRELEGLLLSVKIVLLMINTVGERLKAFHHTVSVKNSRLFHRLWRPAMK